jgi:hypothetical protein
MDKPRVRFCWNCGKKLYGNHFKEVEVDGYKKIVHKTCADPDAECRDRVIETNTLKKP